MSTSAVVILIVLVILLCLVYVYRDKIKAWWNKEFPQPPNSFYKLVPANGPNPPHKKLIPLPPTNPPNYTLYYGQTTPCGKSCNLGGAGIGSFEGCESACTANNTCNEFQFANNQCTLKNAPLNVNMVSSNGWTGVKKV